MVIGSELAVDKQDRSITLKHFVRRYGAEGEPRHDYAIKEGTIKLDAGAKVHERDVVFPRESVAVGADGRVYIGQWASYEVQVYSADGKLEGTLRRPFEPWKRGGMARSVARFQMAVMLWGIPNLQLELEDYEASILRVRCAPDGARWVQSARDVYERRDTVFAAWDVFDASGSWTKHVEIEAPGSPVLDAMVLTDEGTAIVVTNFLDQVNVHAGLPSYAKQMGREGQELELICYRLDRN